MQPTNTSRRRLWAVVIAVIVVLFGLGVWAAVHHTPSVSLPYAVQGGTAVTTAAPAGDGSVILVSGGGFVRYDLATGRSDSLSSPGTTGLTKPDFVALASNQQFILFHQFVADLPSDLASSLSAHGLAAGTDYWWVYEVDSHTFEPLPDSTLIAKIHDSQVVALTASSSGETLTTYSVPGLKTASSIPVSAASDFFPLPSGYLLQTSSGDVLATTDGVVSKRVLTATNLVGVTDDGTYAVATQTTGKVQSLIAINLADYSSKIIAKDISGQTAWNDSGVVLFGQQKGTDTAQPQLTYYDTVSGKIGRWSIGKDGTLDSARPVIVFSDTSGVVQAGDGNYFVVSSTGLSNTIQSL